ncbi:MFS sugar transporter [Mycena indigotica]|uniref:MFS sugar transporter n=1 Tax=Mycena indigotica TaxID=2126181 RepID=A0A8H6W804_9AGAR|nr:MFS sugar transporter [Mycena indigotica]KAF7306361.1 MFS sugar transporter [Mycena indigotica]
MPPYFGFRGQSLNNMLVVSVVMPAYLLFGFNNGVAGGLLDLPAWAARFPTLASPASGTRAHVQGTVVAAYTLGALFGALACGFLGDVLGRRRTIMLGAAVGAAGSALEASAFSLAQLVVGRVVCGVGLGLISATAPNWQTECSRAGHRGFMVMLEGLFISAGLALQAFLNFGISHAKGDVTWRFSLAFSCFLDLVVFVSTPCWPESPRWLVKQGRLTEARAVLAALDDTAPDDAHVDAELRAIEASLAATGTGNFRDVFTNGPARIANRAFVAAAAQFAQQMCGINVLGYYQTTIFRTYLGLDAQTARILSATVFTWQTLCAPLGAFTIDHVGRRPLMMLGAGGMGLCMALIAGLTARPADTAAVHAAIAFVYLFSTAFVTGFLGLAFLYSAEIAPLAARTRVTALSTTATWLFNFVVVEATPTGVAKIGWRYFLVYAVINWCVILPMVYFLFPETQGLHLESVDTIFLESRSVLDPVRVAKRLRAEARVDRRGAMVLGRAAEGEKDSVEHDGHAKEEEA